MNKQGLQIKNNLIENFALAGIVGFTILAGALLSIPSVLADNEAVDTVTITIPSACSLTSTVSSAHTATLDSGTYEDEIGTTTLKTICNDSDGFSLYAIGYTDDEYGNTVLKSSHGDTSNVITGTATSGNTSNWAMKLEAGTGTYAPTIESDTNGSFANYHVIPDSYTKVASFNSTTDATTGSTFTTTYAAYMNPTQPAGTYEGKVKYSLVHPDNAEAPTLPPDPLSSCSTRVPNIVYMQDITSSNYSTVLSSMEKNQQYFLRDKRDETPYCVSRLDDGTADGTIWMTQNLRITGTITAELSNFTGEDINICEGDVASGYNYDEPRCHDSGDVAKGVWYNYASATAKTITGNSNSTVATEDICPANWHLPNYDTNNTAGSVNSIVNASDSTKSAFQPVAGGHYSNGSHIDIYTTDHGWWWSTAAYDPLQRYIFYYHKTYYSESLNTGYGGRDNNFYIRCTR